MPEWSVLYVSHNHEKAASRFLAAHGVDHYLPLYVEQSVWLNRQRVVVERPVFPGYVFVCFAPEQRKLALRAPGVVCLAGKEKIGTITLTYIESLRKAVVRGERPQFPCSQELLTPCTPRRSQTTVPASSADADGSAHAGAEPRAVAL
jgi:hypothetical protein